MILKTGQLLQGVLTKSGAGMSLLIPLTRYQLDISGDTAGHDTPTSFFMGQCESSNLITILDHVYISIIAQLKENDQKARIIEFAHKLT